MALFDLLTRDGLTQADRKRIKTASQALLAGVLEVIAPLDRWTEKETTQADVKTYILNSVFTELPDPPYTEVEKLQVANDVYRHIWQQSLSNHLLHPS